MSGYDLVIAIVNKGWSERVIKIFTSTGAKGATVIKGRGSGAFTSLLGIPIEPEKEIIFSVMPESISNTAMTAALDELNLKKPGTGIAIVFPLKAVVGLPDMDSYKD